MTRPTTHARRAALAAVCLTMLSALAACGRGSDRPRDSAAGTTARDSAPRADSAAATAVTPAAGVSARGRWMIPCLRVTEDASAIGRDTVCFRAERAYDLAGDGRPFTLAVEGRGPRADSLRVTLRITRDDTLFYRAAWGTDMYGRYDTKPVGADSARRRTENQLARLLSDSAFRPTLALLAGASDRDRLLRETITFDVSVAEERRRRGLGPTARLPQSAAQSPRPTTDSARVRALAAELRDRPAFRYFAGGEATYAIAWSPTERRFVVVHSCC